MGLPVPKRLESVRYDKASVFVKYVGKAPLGSSETAETWQIALIDKSAGVTSVKYPGGNPNYAFKWSDRASLSYL